MQTETFNVSGLIRPHVKQHWLTQGMGRQLGRFDAATGQFRAHYDAGESAFTQRALAYIDRQVFATLVPPLEARTFIPTTVKGHPGDAMYVWRKYTRTGIARLFAPSAGIDLPRASFYVEEISQRSYPVGVKIVYDYWELLAVGAALANGQPVDLIGEEMMAAMEAIEKKLDILAAFGTGTLPGTFGLEVEADVGMTGLLNNANATAYTVPVGASGQTAWSTKTPDEILLDLNGIVGAQVANSYKVHRPDTILVPILQDEQQLQRRMSDVSGETIKSFFLRTRREGGHPIDIVSWQYMAGAGTNGADLMVAYKRDPRMFEHVLMMDATPLAPTTQGAETTQQVVARSCGTVLRYPLSVSTGSGI